MDAKHIAVGTSWQLPGVCGEFATVREIRAGVVTFNDGSPFLKQMRLSEFARKVRPLTSGSDRL